MARLVTYKMLSKKVDIVIRIIDDCKRKNKPLAKNMEWFTKVK